MSTVLTLTKSDQMSDYDINDLRQQIAKNSRLIDQSLQELKEISNGFLNSIDDKAIT